MNIVVIFFRESVNLLLPNIFLLIIIPAKLFTFYNIPVVFSSRKISILSIFDGKIQLQAIKKKIKCRVEYWNDGILENPNSTIPLFQHSMSIMKF